MTGIRTEDVSAAYEDGILKLTLPRSRKRCPLRVSWRSHNE
ncbi:MAG: hypothetical protein R2912_03975 [Eubacteriales bacterium]